MKRLMLLAPILVGANSCSGPVANAQDLNGCYFAGGSDWVFKISDAILTDRRGHFLSKIKLSKPSLGDSVVVLMPGIDLTGTPQKSMDVVQGETRKLLATKRQSAVHLIFLDAIGHTDFLRRQCTQ
jgi:hypothetical protein